MILTFYQVLFPVLLVLSFGFILGKKTRIETRTLSTLSLYVLSPALIFQSLVHYEGLFNIISLKMFGIIALVILIIVLGVELFSRWFKISNSVKVALTLTLTLSNTGNFGLPINEYAFGEQAFVIATLVMVIYSFFTNTLGVFMAASDKHEWKPALKQMFHLPFFYVLIPALILNYFNVRVPDPIFKPLRAVGLAAIPVNLIQLGINLSGIRIKKYWGPISAAVVLKLAVIPIISYFLLRLFGISGLEFKVTLTQIAMPSAVYASILASHFESDEALTSGIVFATTLFSVITLSILIFFLNST